MINVLAAGFLLGAAFTLSVVYLPARSRWRARLETAHDIRRIEAGIAPALARQPYELDDAAGALQQAKAAYLPIYPGPGREPSPAWVAWVEQSGFVYGEGRDQYQAGHRAPEPTVPMLVRPGEADTSAFPDWDPSIWEPQRPEPAPAGWAVTYRLVEWPLVPLALAFALTQRRSRYPWWQKVADRVWEWGVVFEVAGQRVNRAVLRELDAVLGDGLVVGRALESSGLRINRSWEPLAGRIAWRLIDAWVLLQPSVAWARRVLPTRRVTPAEEV